MALVRPADRHTLYFGALLVDIAQVMVGFDGMNMMSFNVF